MERGVPQFQVGQPGFKPQLGHLRPESLWRKEGRVCDSWSSSVRWGIIKHTRHRATARIRGDTRSAFRSVSTPQVLAQGIWVCWVFVLSTSHFQVTPLWMFLSLETRTKTFCQKTKCWVRGREQFHGTCLIQAEGASTSKSVYSKADVPFCPHPCQHWAFSFCNCFLI